MSRAESVSAAAERMYPGVTFDTALPQPWVDAMRAESKEVRGHFVWLYPEGCTFGMPAPVTVEALTMCKY